MFTNKVPKSSNEYVCETCDYHTSRLSQYNRHILTAKHKMFTHVDTNVDNKVPKSSKAFVCDCGKEYNFASGLSRHKKKCQYITEEQQPIENTLVISKQDLVTQEEPTDKQLMMTIIKQNGELVQQNGELMQKNGELVKTIQEIVPKIGDTTNNTNCNNNNTFNVQMFLDNQCKNAISIQDLINSIELNNSDLVAIGNNGYVDSISNILIKALNKLDVTDRPLHCTDLKRDVVYYKTDKWNKSKSTDEVMDKTVEKIENKHYPLISNYRKETPDANEVGTKEHTIYEKTFKNILGNNVDQDKRNKQIFKKVLPEVKLDKEHHT